MDSYTPETEERFNAIQQRTGMNRQEVVKEFEEILDDVRDDPQFDTPESLQNYAAAILWAKYVSRMQVKATDVIPVGFEGLRQTRTKKVMSAMYVISHEKNKNILRRISLPQVVNDLYRKVNYLSEKRAYRYSVKLGRFGNSDTADFAADDRTKFENPTPINLSAEKFREMFNIPVMTIKEVLKNPSKLTSTGYTIRNDWRCVRGIVARASLFTRKKSGLEGGAFGIIDQTTPTETIVTPEGKKIESTFTVWSPSEFMVWDRQSHLEFYGTVAVDKKEGTGAMNAFLILPIRGIEKPVEEPEEEVD